MACDICKAGIKIINKAINLQTQISEVDQQGNELKIFSSPKYIGLVRRNGKKLVLTKETRTTNV